MTRTVLLFSLLLLASCGRCGAQEPAPAGSGRGAAGGPAASSTGRRPPTAEDRPGSTSIAKGGPQFLESTTAGASPSEALPMIVAIHGMGDRPESWIGPWGGLPVKARIIAPRAPRRYGSGFSWFTYPPKSEESAAQEIREAADLVAAGLHAWQEDRPTVGKPIVTGFSQGGFLSFAIAVLHPGDVALAIPMSGGLPRPLVPREPIDAAAFPPIFAVHGDADRLVPISMAREPVQRMRALGMRADLVELPGVDHTMNGEMWTRLHGRVVTELK